MKTSRQLKEERSVLETEANALIETAKKESRSFNAEENTKIVDLETRITKLDDEIRAAESAEKIAARAAGANGSKGEEKEIQKNFRMVSYINDITRAAQGHPLEGFAREVSEEASKEARELGVTIKGHGVPQKFLRSLETRDMTATGTTSVTGDQGGMTVQTDVRGFIDGLSDKIIMKEMGATFLTGLVGNLTLPGLDGDATATWESEVATNDESSPTTRKVSMSPKRVGTFIDVSKQLLLQSSWDVEMWMRNRLQLKTAVAVQIASINGSGSSNQPTGILNTSGIGSVAIGTNGGAPTWAHLVKLEEAVAVDNADLGALGYLTNTKVRSKLKQTALDAGSGLFIWSQHEKDAPLNGYKAGISNSVPGTLEKGSSGAVCSAIIFGNFNDLVIGQWGGIDLEINPYTKAKEATVEVVINSWWDIGVLRPESFAACVDAITT